ncbi:MAG: hypothetical protein RL226_154 [Bacteroidota bacterium]
MSRKISALIVDDELLARENLSMLIADFCPDVEVVGLASNAKEARSMADELEPDLLFLDIMMPGEDGFALLKSIADRAFEVIFTTAHNEHALRAFKEKAVDYLEKPISIDELRSAIERAVKLIDSKKTSLVSEERITRLLETIALTSNAEKIAIPTKDGLAFLNYAEIIHLDAHDSYTELHLTEGRKYVSSKTIRLFEEKLNPHMFFRIHKSHVINITNHLKEFNRSDSMVVMSNGVQLPISRRKLSSFMERISEL